MREHLRVSLTIWFWASVIVSITLYVMSNGFTDSLLYGIGIGFGFAAAYFSVTTAIDALTWRNERVANRARRALRQQAERRIQQQGGRAGVYPGRPIPDERQSIRERIEEGFQQARNSTLQELLHFDIEEKQPTIPQPKRAPLFLHRLELIIEDNHGKLRRGKVVNPQKDVYVRPVAVFEVNDKSIVGKVLPLEFNIVRPRGEIQYRYRIFPVLQKGDNRAYPSDSRVKVPKNILQGTYQLRLWAYTHEWGEISFVVSSNNLDDAAKKIIGADLEIKSGSDKILEQLAASTSMDEMLH